MKKIFAVTALAMIASGSFAAQDNSGCQGNCAVGTTTNNTTNNTTNQGGQGGQGYGGNSVANGGSGGSVANSGNSQASGGDVKNAGNSNNRNTNRNANKNTNTTGNNTNANNSNATSYGSVATTAQSTSLTVQGDTTNYQAPRIPVSTAYAPNIMPTAVCMGSSSAGVQGMSVGVSLGTSWTDSNCMLLEQVRTVAAVLGDRETAAEMMMAIPAYREARERMSGKKVTKVDVRPMAPVEFVQTSYSLLGN